MSEQLQSSSSDLGPQKKLLSSAFSRRSLLGYGAAGAASLLLTAGALEGVPGSYNRMWDVIVVGQDQRASGPHGISQMSENRYSS